MTIYVSIITNKHPNLDMDEGIYLYAPDGSKVVVTGETWNELIGVELSGVEVDGKDCTLPFADAFEAATWAEARIDQEVE